MTDYRKMANEAGQRFVAATIEETDKAMIAEVAIGMITGAAAALAVSTSVEDAVEMLQRLAASTRIAEERRRAAGH